MPGFEHDLKKLESIVERLEHGDLTLEESVKLFEEGMQLSQVCKSELEGAEGRIRVLMQGKRGELQPRPLDAGENDPLS